MDLSALSGDPPHPSGSTVANAAACLHAAKHLLRAIDAPHTVPHWHGFMDFRERPFPRFKAAYAAAFAQSRGGSDALASMSQAQRLALKLVLHEDVKAIVRTAEAEARAPKVLGGAVLPTDPAECLQRVDALALEAEAQRRALEARLQLLEEVRVSVERMANNVAPKHALPDAAFTALPPPTAKQAEQRAAKRARKQQQQ
jgi:hypothetical protein